MHSYRCPYLRVLVFVCVCRSPPTPTPRAVGSCQSRFDIESLPSGLRGVCCWLCVLWRVRYGCIGCCGRMVWRGGGQERVWKEVGILFYLWTYRLAKIENCFGPDFFWKISDRSRRGTYNGIAFKLYMQEDGLIGFISSTLSHLSQPVCPTSPYFSLNLFSVLDTS